jgi:hypothetical protein
MMKIKLLAAVMLLGGVSVSQAQPYVTGNDIGGIISWSPEAEIVSRAVAQGHCGYYGKQAYITSVYRQYGHYIGFACVFPRGYVVRERLVIRAKG